MEWNQILTKTQKSRLIKSAVFELKKLLKTPHADLMGSISIGYTSSGSGLWATEYSLYLTKNGLEYERQSDGVYSSSKVAIKDLAGFVERFELTPEGLRKIREALER